MLSVVRAASIQFLGISSAQGVAHILAVATATFAALVLIHGAPTTGGVMVFPGVCVLFGHATLAKVRVRICYIMIAICGLGIASIEQGESVDGRETLPKERMGQERRRR